MTPVWLIFVIAFLALLVAFHTGLTLGRWYAEAMERLKDIRAAIRRPPADAPAPKPKPDTSPHIVIASKYPQPIDLDEDTGPVMPMTPAQVAREEDEKRKFGG